MLNWQMEWIQFDFWSPIQCSWTFLPKLQGNSKAQQGRKGEGQSLVASLRDSGVLFHLLPLSPGLENRELGKEVGGSLLPSSGCNIDERGPRIGQHWVLKKRDSLSDVVGWHMLHWLPGHQWGTHLSSLGLWADEETRAEIEQVKAVYEAAPSPRHLFSTSREWSGTEMLGLSRSAVGPAPDQYWTVLGIVVLRPEVPAQTAT